MAKKCNPPKKVSRAAGKLGSDYGTKEQRRDWARELAKHRWKNHA